MATAGTASTTTLIGLTYQRAGLNPANVAAIAQGIKDDGGSVQGTTGSFGATGVIWPDAFNTQGLLIIPNRGILQAYPGDFVAFDPVTGWPILLSATAAASASWVHT